jgi:hypothetical protein
MYIYEVRPPNDKRGFDLISDALPLGRLWYGKVDDAIGYARHDSRSHDARFQFRLFVPSTLGARRNGTGILAVLFLAERVVLCTRWPADGRKELSYCSRWRQRKYLHIAITK